jgi:hypothetical protein
MENLLPRVYKEISNYLEKHKAVSGEELMWKIDQEVDKLNDNEKKELEKLLKGDVSRMIFDGITGKIRLSVFSPDMHVSINYLGDVFYCPPTHKYMPEELGNAFKRLAQMKFDEVSQKIEDTIRNLMTDSGCATSDIQTQIKGVFKSIQTVKDDQKLQLLIFPSIVFVSECLKELEEIPHTYVVAIPSEKTPAPFVNFIRENIDTIRGNKKMMVWVVNSDQMTVSPFLGKPADKDIWNKFKDPEKSLMASQNWMKGMMRSRVLDEDF